MADITLVKTARSLIPIGTSNAAGGTTRGTLDLRTAHGGLLTIKITNGASAPTVAPTCNILVAHDNGATPTAASRGAAWKLMWSFSGDTTANSITEQPVTIEPGVMHLEVEITGNTGQAVTCEALFSEVTKAVSA